MSALNRYTIAGTVFVIITGTLAHFFYEWSNNNLIVGLFTPTNESTWEHMKLIFFPMLIYSFIAHPKLKDLYPCITSSLLSGILVGTALIPAIFYTYTGIIGYHLLILDISAFILSVVCAFYTVYKLTLSCRMMSYTKLLYVIVHIVLTCFVIFTFYPPKIAIFAEP